MNYRNVVFLCSLLAIVIACATPAKGPDYSGTSVSPAQGQAILYLYRPSRFMLSGAAPDIWVDNQYQFHLPNNSYGYIELSPGLHKIEPRETATWGNLSPDLKASELEVVAGETYFMKFSLDEAGLDTTNINAINYGGHSGFVLVDKNTANSEMIGTKLNE